MIPSRLLPAAPSSARRRRTGPIVGCVLVAVLAASCSGTDGGDSSITTQGVASTVAAESSASSPATDVTASEPMADAEATDSSSASPEATTSFFDSGSVHTVGVDFDEADYDEMIEIFQSDDDKTWIEATVIIDGSTYERVGMRLKGNSSLAGISGGFGPGGAGPAGRAGDAIPVDETADTSDTSDASDITVTTEAATDSAADTTAPPVIVEDAQPAGPGGGFPGGGRGFGLGGDVSVDEPEGLPWLIRLDKYVEDQQHEGVTEFVIRSSSTKSALNEAVALELLGEAGLATEEATPVRFTVNDSDAKLRLAIENPDDEWMAGAFSADGKLYKADAQGDYSYRGDDPDAYATAFEQEGGEDDLTPLVEFLDFVNNSTDEEFAAELDQHLDVAAFADYLAFQDLIDNFDDIDGPGNNSYLYFDPDTGLMTVVAWDHNLAFGSGAGGPGGFPGPPGGFDPSNLPEGFDPTNLPEGFDPTNLPEGFDPTNPPEGFDPANRPEGFPGGGGPFGRSNVLVERFKAVDAFAAMYDASTEALAATLYTSGVGAEILDRWTSVLASQASDLIDADTLEAESAAIAEYFEG